MTATIPQPEPDRRLRTGFPPIETRGLPVDVAVAGILVAMQETQTDGYFVRDGVVNTMHAKAVVVTTGGGAAQ